MPMIVPAVAAAVTWVSSAAAAATAALAGAIATTGISATLSASIAAGTLKLAATALGSLALNAVLAPRVGSAGSPTSFKADPSSPIRGVMGYFGTGGTQAHMRVWGKDNLMISYMVILSLGPIQGISKFEANELQVNFPLPNGEAARVEPYRDKMWMTYKMGLPTDGALSPPPNGGNPRMEWDGNHRTSGYAAAFWTMQNNSKKASYESGVPKPLWSLQGQKLYDPRFDSTQTAIGGSGPQRLNDWRTWGYSENPQVHAFNWALGHHKKLEDGSIDRKFLLAGVGARPDQIDLTTMVAGMNVSDANGWKISGEWNSQDDKWQTFAAMLQAGGSSPIHVGAKIGIMTNAPKVPVATITSADVIGNMNIKVMASRRDRFNTVYPRYLNELQNWDYSTAGAVSSTVYTDQDGGEERPKELTYNYVRLSLQAGQLAAYDLANTRESLKLAFPAKPYLVGIKPGDAVLVNDEAKGLVNQKFIVTARPIELMEGTIGFELRSETDSKHPWALGQADRPAPSPALSPINPAPSVPADESWTVLPQPPSDGVSQPGFVVVGEVPDGIGSVLIQVGPSEEGPWSDAYNGPPTTESFKINGNDPGKQYWVKIIYYSVKGHPSDPLIKGPYTAPVLISGDTKAVAGIPSSTLTGRLVNVEGIAAQNAEAVADLEAIYGDTASAASSAAEAAQAASDAVQAKADAIIAQGQAQSASAEAILARADTVSAKNEAVSAAGASASAAAQAGGFKTDAETAAAASLQQKVEASAAREAAQAAANTPLATSPALSPDAFNVNNWTTLNAPANLRQFIADNPGKVYFASGGTTVEVNNFASAVHFSTSKGVTRPAGHRFRFTARVQRNVDGGGASDNHVTLFMWAWDESGAEIDAVTLVDQVSLTTGQGLRTLTADYLPSANVAWVKAMVRVVSYVGVTAILSLDTQDIESEKTATAAATASVASAAAAAASESAAGQSASASQQDRVAAQTARGQAEGFRDQSSASATTAAGAASTATEQAGLSAAARDAAQGHASSALTSRNQASGFVTDAQAAAAVSTAQKLEAIAARDEATAKAAASATSAANAAASETAAGLSATASQTARTGAETARGQAETYRNETASARDTAVGSAATATTQAGISASSAAASQAAANTPLATSPALSPDAFSINDWLTLNASPNLRQVFADNPGKIYPINSTVEVNNFGLAVHINTAKAMARPEGHRVRYSARIRRMAEGGDASQNHVTLFAWFWDANGNEIGVATLLETNPGTAQGTQNLSVDYLPFAGTAWTRTMVRVVSYVGVTAILSLDTQDIESEKTATAAATASVASASTASTKADEAGASASAASAAKIASELARDNASGSASASATSAGQSLTYRNQAGEFASASGGSATAANTAAGNAQTFASQASTSAGNANTAAINAGVSAQSAADSATGAAGSAASALQQAANASSSAAAASISANLATQVGQRPNRLPNSDFSNGFARWRGADGWASYVHGSFGPLAYSNASGHHYLISEALALGPNSTFTLSIVGDPGGNPGGGGFYLQYLRSDMSVISDGNAFRNYGGMTWSNRISTTFTTTSDTAFVIAVFWKGETQDIVHLSRVMIAFGTDMVPWNDSATTLTLSASLSVTASTTADLATRMASARFEVIAAAGSDPAQLLIRADNSGSLAALVATSIRFSNVVGGQIAEAMKLIGGEVFFMRPIYIDVGGSRLIVGPGGTWVLWFGETSQTAATATRTNGVFCLGTDGKVYYGTAELGGAGKANGVKRFASGAGGSVAVSTPFENTQVGSLITCTGSIDGGSLKIPGATVQGTVSIYEKTSNTERLLFSRPVEMTSGGLQNPNGSYEIESGGSWSGQQFGELSGSVSYRVVLTMSGPNYFVNGATISAAVVVTPAA